MDEARTRVGEHRIRSQIYVVLEAGPAAADRLGAAFAAADIASVLIRAPKGSVLDARGAQPLVQLAQAKGAAALIEDNAELARALRADGVHLTPCEDPAAKFETAREIVGGRAIVGVDPGRSRHDAMTLAELGADYMAFGPDGEGGADERDALCGWWAEIFEIPCVALGVAGGQEAASLQAQACEFVALALPSAEPVDASRVLVTDVAAALARQYAEAEA